MGTAVHEQPGKWRSAAAPSRRAASADDSVPLSESDAKTNLGARFMAPPDVAFAPLYEDRPPILST